MRRTFHLLILVAFIVAIAVTGSAVAQPPVSISEIGKLDVLVSKLITDTGDLALAVYGNCGPEGTPPVPTCSGSLATLELRPGLGATVLGQVTSDEAYDDAEIVDNYVYLAASKPIGYGQPFDDRLAILDITNPSAIVELASIPLPTFNFDYTQDNILQVVGNYLYVGGLSEVLILDISVPAAPVEAGRMEAGFPLLDMTLLENTLALAIYLPASEYGDSLILYDVSNPTSPTRVGGVVGHFQGVEAVAGRLFAENTVLCSTGGYTESPCGELLQEYDITTPSSPQRVWTANGLEYTNGIAADNNFLYAGRDSNLIVYNLHQPDRAEVYRYAIPAEQGRYPGVMDVVTHGPHVYLATALMNQRTVRTLDVQRLSSVYLPLIVTPEGGN